MSNKEYEGFLEEFELKNDGRARIKISNYWMSIFPGTYKEVPLILGSHYKGEFFEKENSGNPDKPFKTITSIEGTDTKKDVVDERTANIVRQTCFKAACNLYQGTIMGVDKEIIANTLLYIASKGEEWINRK